ncbi:MAG TPA: TetR/AcrR family transcriptional regulator [Anaerovoracaceae bacterium]|nr:TetR/AcrR family transcriptional regulator [Anaerovoracaceae bacterium]
MNSRQKKALITKNKIYNSALELIKRKGYENVLIEDITDYAGLSKGSFYNHFSSKENLLHYTYKKTDIIYLNAYNEIESNSDFLKMIRLFVRLSYVEIEKLGNEIIRAMCLNLLSEETKETFFDKERALYTSLEKIIEVGKNSNILNSRIKTEFYVNKIITLMVGIENYWCLLDKEEGLPDFAEESINTLIIGMIEI